MVFARTILAALIAISLATVRVEGTALSVAPVQMSTIDQADMPCCPPSHDSKNTVACVFKCLNFVAAILPPTATLSHIANRLPRSFGDTTLHGYVSRPTHPPPI